MDYTEQLQRIKRKLQSVRELDPECKRSFGADKHRYQLGKPLTEEQIKDFETKARISLPEDYRAFITTVGGGIDDEHAGAGPYYGLYSLKRIGKFRGYSSSEEEYFRDFQIPCTAFPDMDSEDWEEISVNQWEKASEEEEIYPYCGMMILGTQGCTYQMMLILNGEYRGRVVCIDEECSGPPLFVYEKNFLDWYEHWLDEILAGYDLRGFGYNICGDEQTLTRLFRESNDETLKIKCIGSFAKFPHLDETSLSFLETVVQTDSPPVKYIAFQMLTKFDYPRSKPYLAQAIRGAENEKLAALQAIIWYAGSHNGDWVEQILSVLPEIEKEDTLFRASIILKDSKAFYDKLLTIPDPPEFVRKKLIDKFGLYPALGYPADSIVSTAIYPAETITHTTMDHSESFNSSNTTIVKEVLKQRKSFWAELRRLFFLR